MKNLKYFQEIIKEKRKSNSFRYYLKEIVSWLPLTYHKNNDIISRFPISNRCSVINYIEFEKNRDELLKYGKNYDFFKSFFDNFKSLFVLIKLPNLNFYGNNENTDYSDQTFNSKNVYLSNTTIVDCENIAYNFSVHSSKNVYNSLYIKNNSDIIYFSGGISESFKIFYSNYINNSSNIWFSSNLVGCRECIFCNNLENQKYCINNKKLDKEEYFKQKDDILNQKNKFNLFFSKIEKIGKNYGSKKVTGNYIIESENIENSSYVIHGKNGKNMLFTGGFNINENFYDVFSAGGAGGNDFYGVISAGLSENLYCSILIVSSLNIFYSYFLENCSYCIGCIGLKNKSYCILNKQYEKKEWEELASKIFSQMEKNGTLGDFFPGELNPFYFNDTVAGLIGGFTKEEVEKDGYMWRNKEIKVDIPRGVEVIKTTDLGKYEGFDNNGNWKINPEILKVVIIDKKGNYYRIVQMEYDFLVKYELPLPRIHWLDRIKLGFGV